MCVKTEAEGKTCHTAARLLVTYGRVGAIQADGPRHPLPGSAAACSFGLTVILIPGMIMIMPVVMHVVLIMIMFFL